MDKKTTPIRILSTRDLLHMERNTQTESKGMGKGISCKWSARKKTGAAIFISDKIDIETEAVLDQEHFKIINRSMKNKIQP